MRLYNTLTKQVEPLSPITSPTVTVYTCGPTVYDYAHIGHWFTYIRWDTLIRVLQSTNLEPKWVMNITDVGHLVSDADEGEDKLEKGARREGKTAWDVADFYTKDFLDEMQSLHIQNPTFITKATDHIAEQIELIKTLESKGYTYTIDDGVYYDTSKFGSYADFARLDLEEQEAGKRVDFNPQKRNVSDFALWKFSPKDHKRDMEWDSPWGIGFPGWHVECSAMSMKYLGETLDIHTGGIDHIPVHHTNEIAQSEAATGKPLANMWLHSNHVLIDGEKISKSLGNGIRLKDIVARGISLEAFRLHVLESHYRSQSKFSWESLEAAHNRLQNYRAAAALQHQPMTTEQWLASSTNPEIIIEAMQDDLNSPKALKYLSGLMSKVEEKLLANTETALFKEILSNIDTLLGTSLAQVPDINPEQKAIIAKRTDARASKDWNASDMHRETLLAQGIGLRDTSAGTVWFWA